MIYCSWKDKCVAVATKSRQQVTWHDGVYDITVMRMRRQARGGDALMAMVAILGWLHCLLAAAAGVREGGGGAHTGNHGNNGPESDCRTNDSVSNGDDMGTTMLPWWHCHSPITLADFNYAHNFNCITWKWQQRFTMNINWNYDFLKAVSKQVRTKILYTTCTELLH